MRPSSIRRLDQSDICLLMFPQLAKEIGRNEAIFLQQLHYWLTSDKANGTSHQNKRWIYNTYQGWQEQLKIVSISTIRRVVKKLEQIGFITCCKLSKKRSDQTKWYTINYEALGSLIPSTHENLQLLKMNSPCVQNEQMINKETETTSEIKHLSSEGSGNRRETVIRESETQQVHDVQEENKLINKNPEYKSNLAANLLKIWNQTVGKEQGEGRDALQLTKKRAQHLVAAFKYRFESNQLKWKQFCQKVISSDFLMGKVKSTFKASLDWVLKFDIIQRILEGDFGVKEGCLRSEESLQLDAQTLSLHIESKDDSHEVKQFRKSILKTFGEQTYQSWFADMPITEEGRGVVLKAKSQFISDYIQTHYLAKLQPLTSRFINVSLGAG